MADDLTDRPQPTDDRVVTADGREFATGWVRAPNESRRTAVAMGAVPLSRAAPLLLSDPRAAGDEPVFFWESERKVLGRVLPSWDQGQVGSCVSFGYGRGAQDLLLNEVAAGQAEQWPGAEIATEPIYGGSRVEVGGGRINGDGSIGAWAAKWVKDWGLLVRKKYEFGGQVYDLERYNESRCRQYGRDGVPAALEAEAKIHPVTDVAQVRTADELWAALGAGKPVPVCSGQGFTTTRDADGFCRLSGSWAHCMLYRGRFVHPRRGRSVIEQNSWGGYLRGPDVFEYVAADGSVKTETLPEGCFCVPLADAARALREDDTFALAGLTGWAVVPPPSPPNPPVPPMHETLVVELTAKLAGFSIPLTLTGTAKPAPAAAGFPDLDFAKWVRVARLVADAVAAYRSQNWAALVAALQSLLKEFGIVLTAQQIAALAAGGR